MGKNNVYAFFGTHSPINAGANETLGFDLGNDNRTMSIKSIMYDLKIYNSANFELLPINRDSFIHTRLNIGTNTTSNISKPFRNFTGGATIVQMYGFSLYKPAFLIYDNFYIVNVLPCSFYIENHDAAINVGYEVCVTMEVEEQF